MLALWPAGQVAPEWLERTRYVCFGIDASGLPNAGGWVALVGSPLGMLAVLFAGWGRETIRALRRCWSMPAGRAAMMAVMLMMAWGGSAAARLVGDAMDRRASFAIAAFDDTSTLTHPRLDRVAPPLELIDHKGDVLRLEELRGRTVLLTFAFGQCETVCPVIVRDALHAQAAMEPAAPFVVIVTLDPWRDTPARLPHIARAWGLGDDARLLGGDPAVVEDVLDHWNVQRSRDMRTGDITHASLVYILDAEGRIAFAATGGADRLTALLRQL